MELIALTESQMSEAKLLLYQKMPLMDATDCISAVVAIVNRVRAGDLPGTIRRRHDGAIAVRTHYYEGDRLGWRVYDFHAVPQDHRKAPIPNEQWIGPAGECDWPIIFSPEGA